MSLRRNWKLTLSPASRVSPPDLHRGSAPGPRWDPQTSSFVPRSKFLATSLILSHEEIRMWTAGQKCLWMLPEDRETTVQMWHVLTHTHTHTHTYTHIRWQFIPYVSAGNWKACLSSVCLSVWQFEEADPRVSAHQNEIPSEHKHFFVLMGYADFRSGGISFCWDLGLCAVE